MPQVLRAVAGLALQPLKENSDIVVIRGIEVTRFNRQPVGGRRLPSDHTLVTVKLSAPSCVRLLELSGA